METLSLPDHLTSGLDVVIVATAVECAARQGHYYAGRGNAFWRLLHESGLTPRVLTPEEDASLPGLGIGLTDLARKPPAAARRPAYDVSALEEKLARHQPRWLAFHGKAAAHAYARALGHRVPGLGPAPFSASGSRVFVLPSASVANRRKDYEGRSSRAQWWLELAELVRDGPES